MCTFRNLSRKIIRIPMESSPFDARKHNLMILSWGFPKSFFALQIIPHTNKQELVATTTWHQINPILPLFHKICLTWSGIYLPLSQRTFISTQTNMFSASNLFSTGMGIAKPPSPSPIPTNRPTWIFLLNIISFGCSFLKIRKRESCFCKTSPESPPAAITSLSKLTST